jgi:hypothetical protein
MVFGAGLYLCMCNDIPDGGVVVGFTTIAEHVMLMVVEPIDKNPCCMAPVAAFALSTNVEAARVPTV